MKAIDVRLRKRIYALLSLFVLVVLALMAGLYRHQVTQRERYLTWADRQQLQPIRLIPLRGKILDCRGAPMAVSLEGGSLFSHPASVEDPVLTARLLAPHLEMDERSLRARLRQSLSFVWLARQLPLKKARAVQELGLSGIGMEKEGKRYYPNRDLAANVIGFVGVDSQGLEGLELYYEGRVRGAQASLLLQRDARGRLLWREMAEAPDLGRGSEIALTLDLRIQFAAERSPSAGGGRHGSLVRVCGRSGPPVRRGARHGLCAHLQPQPLPGLWTGLAAESLHHGHLRARFDGQALPPGGGDRRRPGLGSRRSLTAKRVPIASEGTGFTTWNPMRS